MIINRIVLINVPGINDNVGIKGYNEYVTIIPIRILQKLAFAVDFFQINPPIVAGARTTKVAALTI